MRMTLRECRGGTEDKNRSDQRQIVTISHRNPTQRALLLVFLVRPGRHAAEVPFVVEPFGAQEARP